MRASIFLGLALALASSSAFADAKLLKRVEPVYPPQALREGTTGYVEVEMVIAPDGSVQQVSVAKASPVRVFEQAATKAVKQWKFEATNKQERAKVRLNFAAS